MRTWHKEALLVGSILVCVATTKGQPIEWLSALAVFLTFMHTQVSVRLAEAETRRSNKQVECAQKAVYYLVGKEICWFLYFAWLGAWSAEVGVVVFLLYPIWRRYHLNQRIKKVTGINLLDELNRVDTKN